MQCQPEQPLQSNPVRPVLLLQTPQRRGLFVAGPRLAAKGDAATELFIEEFNSSAADFDKEAASLEDEEPPFADGIWIGSELLVTGATGVIDDKDVDEGVVDEKFERGDSAKKKLKKKHNKMTERINVTYTEEACSMKERSVMSLKLKQVKSWQQGHLLQGPFSALPFEVDDLCSTWNSSFRKLDCRKIHIQRDTKWPQNPDDLP